MSQIFFFLGITYRQLHQYDEAVQSYQNAIQLNHFFSDCYFNLGNIYYEQSDFAKADLCYKSSLEALEEDRKIQMYRHLDDDYSAQPQAQQEKSQIVTCGRICNMIAETSKEIATIDVAIKYYLKGIAFEPLFLDNIIDLSNLCY